MHTNLLSCELEPPTPTSFEFQPSLPPHPGNRRYIFGLIASLFFCLLLVATIWAPAWSVRVLSFFGFGGDYDGVLSLLVVFVYYGNAFASPVLRYLWRMNSLGDFVTYVDGLKATAPTLGFECQCSHTITRGMETSVSNSDGSQTSSVQTQTEKVVTYSGREEFVFSRWEDISPPTGASPTGSKVIAVDLSYRTPPGDDVAKTAYDDARQRFFDAFRLRDQQFESSEFSFVPNFHPKMLLLVDRTRKPLLMHWLVYVSAALIGLSWPYRIWFESQTVHVTTEIHKRFFA